MMFTTLPSDYRCVCGGGYETEKSELRELATLGFKQPYCGRQGYTAVDRRHPLLLVGQR